MAENATNHLQSDSIKRATSGWCSAVIRVTLLASVLFVVILYIISTQNYNPYLPFPAVNIVPRVNVSKDTIKSEQKPAFLTKLTKTPTTTTALPTKTAEFATTVEESLTKPTKTSKSRTALLTKPNGISATTIAFITRPRDHVRISSPSIPSTLNVTVPGWGQLGNILFQFASLLSIAHTNHFQPVVISRIHGVINYTFKSDKCEVPVIRDEDREQYLRINVHSKMQYDPVVASLKDYAAEKNAKNLYLRGSFQSYKYFDKDRIYIKQCLQFKDSIHKRADKFWEKVPKNRTVVGIHVRRGDFLLDYNLERGFSAPRPSFFFKAMDWMRNKYGKDVIFIAVSRDKKWCKETFKTSVLHSNFRTYPCDFALLTRCHHHIISGGTFGWWAAWLAGGTTIYFDGYPSPGSPFDKETKKTRRKDYFMPEWIPMND